MSEKGSLKRGVQLQMSREKKEVNRMKSSRSPFLWSLSLSPPFVHHSFGKIPVSFSSQQIGIPDKNHEVNTTDATNSFPLKNCNAGTIIC